MFLAVILSWIGAALAVGLIASKFVNLRGDDPKLGVFAAMAGAVLVGVVYSLISATSVSTWSVWAFGCACIGAVVGVSVWHLVRSRTISHERQTARRSY